MSKCASRGCKMPALFSPKIIVPALGWSVEQHQPLSCIVALPLCKVHKANFSIFDAVKRSDIELMFRGIAAGKCPPDFARLTVAWVELDSEEYQSYESSLFRARTKGQMEGHA